MKAASQSHLLTSSDVHDVDAFVHSQCRIRNERIKANHNNSTKIKVWRMITINIQYTCVYLCSLEWEDSLIKKTRSDKEKSISNNRRTDRFEKCTNTSRYEPWAKWIATNKQPCEKEWWSKCCYKYITFMFIFIKMNAPS